MKIHINHDENHKEDRKIKENEFTTIKTEIEKEKNCKLQTVRHWHNKSQMFLMEEVEGVGNITHATISCTPQQSAKLADWIQKY